jgi:argininosuccinate lyase
MAEVQGVALPDLTLEDLLTLHKAFDEDVAAVWSFEGSVDRRDVTGGTSRRAVQEQIDLLRAWLDQPIANPHPIA